MVAISAIRPNGFNPRKHFDEVSLNELAESIRQQGILQPVTVRHIADGNGYELVFGERRYRAATIVGMQEIPAIISQCLPTAHGKRTARPFFPCRAVRQE